jgi:hypothetical protein
MIDISRSSKWSFARFFKIHFTATTWPVFLSLPFRTTEKAPLAVEVKDINMKKKKKQKKQRSEESKKEMEFEHVTFQVRHQVRRVR